MARSTLTARIEAAREFFSLRDTEARAETIPADRRASMAKGLVLAEQKREAAEVLWLSGDPAEAFKLAREAFLLAFDASEPARAETPESIVATKSTLEDTKVPDLDVDVTDAHRKLFEVLLRDHDSLVRGAEPLALDKSAIARKRVQRIALGALGLVAFVALVWFLVHTPKTIRAEASAAYADRFPAEAAVDGRNETEWLLPDHATGWIDFWIGPPRRIKTLKVLNAHNAPYNDRATKEWHVDVFVKGGQLAKSIDGAFAEFSAEPAWVSIPIDVDGVERIRFEVRGSHMAGGGLAEVQVE